MTDSRSRFEVWARTLPYRFYFDCFTDTNGVTCYASSNTQSAWEAWQVAWQAAEAETARRCVEWINAWALDSDRHANMLNSIKQEFPGAWE